MTIHFRAARFLIPALLFLMCSLAISSYALAKEVIKEISISGQKKIEESAIRAKIQSQVGSNLDPQRIRQDIKDLFGTGFFYNVVVDKKPAQGGVALNYIVSEKPTISEIKFEGNDEIEGDELREAVGIKVYEILDMAKVNEAIAKLEKLYEEKGYFLARVKANVVPGKDNTSTLNFGITENEKVKVAKIRFLGNTQMPSTKLKSVMQTQEGGYFSFMSGSGAYKQDVFDRDIQLLYYLVYYNEGYIQAKIDRPQTYVTPDKKSIYITIRIEEGERFNVGEVTFTGDLLFPDSELYNDIKIKSGELFVYSTLQSDLGTLQAKYGDLGYAYANIIPRTRAREKEKLVDVTFEIDKGNKVYIGRINMSGNTKTRDKVIRREMQILEGELYNETRKRESLNNIKRLGYFEDVTFNTKTPQGRPDIMDIDVVVKERNTGTIQLGAGYSNFGGFLLNGQVNQINLFGRGQKLGLSIDYSDKQKVFNLNFTEPYFMDTEWSLGGDLYSRDRKLTEYDEDKKGVGIRVGHPLAPYLEGSIGYKIDDTTLTLKGDPPDTDLFPVETANGLTSAVTMSLAYDKRDDRFAPTEGMYNSIGIEYAGLGGDLEYTKGAVTARYYKKVFWDVVWRNNFNYGVITPGSSGKDVPFNQLFLLGGANSLRGFDWYSIGKRKYSQKAALALAGNPNAEKLAMKPFGGTQQLYYNLEFQFPLINEAGVKGVVFYDIGYADDDFSLSEFRSNWGFGFRWFSPIGPLRFEFGLPFNRDEVYGERAVNFQFAIGSPF
ncbi:MAG: outer membrane protein assembly factor BamA [Bdellovibrionales bacterium]|nr:outer membrane protein assembly factor BamA [Bdellovibrionales bacterium]